MGMTEYLVYMTKNKRIKTLSTKIVSQLPTGWLKWMLVTAKSKEQAGLQAAKIWLSTAAAT